MPSFRSHVQHLCAVRKNLRQADPRLAHTLDAAWPSAVLGALAADVRYLTGESRQATHGYDHHDPDSMRAGAAEWLHRRSDAAALLRDPGAPTAHVAFIVGYVCHVAFDAWWGLGRLGLLGPLGPDAPAPLPVVDLLPFDPADYVTPDAIATAPLPDGFPHGPIRLIGEFVREMDTCDAAEMLARRLEMPLAKLSPEQREITYRLYEDQLRTPRLPEPDLRALFAYPVSAAVDQLLSAVRPAPS